MLREGRGAQRSQASLDPCTQPACTVAPSALREPLSLVAAATGRAPSSGVFTAQGFWESWAGSAWANSLPPNAQFQTYSNPSKYTAPQLFYGQDHRQENPRFLISPVPSPCRERLAPGPGGFRMVPTLCLPLIPSRAPFLSHPLSPSASSSSNTNCLHGKSPSMTRFSTHKRKLWATDPTS